MLPGERVNGNFAIFPDGGEHYVVTIFNGKVTRQFEANLRDTFVAARDSRADLIDAMDDADQCDKTTAEKIVAILSDHSGVILDPSMIDVRQIS